MDKIADQANSQPLILIVDSKISQRSLEQCVGYEFCNTSIALRNAQERERDLDAKCRKQKEKLRVLLGPQAPDAPPFEPEKVIKLSSY